MLCIEDVLFCSVFGRLGQRPQAAGGSKNAYSGPTRLFAAAIQQPEKLALGKFDARQKLSGQNSGKILDARQKLLQKTKFADARERIEKKKVQVHTEAASDMRAKLLAKRRLNQNTSPATTTATAGKQAAAGQQLAKTTPMLVTVSNQGRIASTLTGDASSTGNKAVAENSFRTSRLVSLYMHHIVCANSVSISTSNSFSVMMMLKSLQF